MEPNMAKVSRALRIYDDSIAEEYLRFKSRQ